MPGLRWVKTIIKIFLLCFSLARKRARVVPMLNKLLIYLVY